MTTKIQKSSAFFQENATRQAKRLHSHLNIPLTTAKMVLAKGLYRCGSWDDLCVHLNAEKPDAHVLLLASLPSSNKAKSYFIQNLGVLASSFSKQMLTNRNLKELYELLRSVFGLPKESVNLNDILESLLVTPWQSANIGPDPDAVIHAYTSINGVRIKLIGTRVYMPEYFRYGPEVTCSPKDAEPNGNFRIMWSNPREWYSSAYAFLTAKEDDDLELVLPEELLDAEMQAHECWLFSALTYNGEYTGIDDQVIPLLLPQGPYLVFGVPTVQSTDQEHLGTTGFSFSPWSDNDAVVALIDGQPISIEWITIDHKTHQHQGDYQARFALLLDGVFRYPDCNPELCIKKGLKASYFFIRPSMEFEIELILRMV